MARGRESTAQGAILVSHTGREKKALSQPVNQGILHFFQCLYSKMNFYLTFLNIKYAAVTYYAGFKA